MPNAVNIRLSLYTAGEIYHPLTAYTTWPTKKLATTDSSINEIVLQPASEIDLSSN